VHFCLDRVEGLGDFVEMEYQGQDLGEGKRRINELRTRLELKGNERRSYLELLLEKG
jgi:predicted adenylyl cyclase CyaB